MIECSSRYKTAIDMNALTIRSKIVVDNIEYLSDVIKTAPKISHKASSICGCFPAKTVDFEIYDYNNNIELKDKEITIYKGIVVDGEIEYLQQGIFIPREEDIETNISTRVISVKGARDKSQYFDDIYSSDIDWSTKHTGLEIVQEICEKKEITLKTSNFSFSNYLFEQPNFPENMTYREVIARLAEIGGEQVFVDFSGQLVIRGQFDTEMIKERKSYVTISEEQTKIIDKVILGKQGKNDDIIYPQNIPNDDNAIKILDNPYVDLHRETMIEVVASHILGLTYMPYKITGFIDGFLYELNDVFYVNDRNNNLARLVVQNITNTTRMKSEYILEDMKKTKTEYKLAGGNSAELSKVRLDVDHINNTITSLSQTVEDNTESITEISQTSEEIVQRVSSVEDEVNLTIKSMVPYYAKNNSRTDSPSSGWSTTIPTRQVNEYLWRKDLITLQNDTSYYQSPYCLTGDKGDSGESGSQIWTTTTAPTTPDYTFSIYNLSGSTGEPEVGDIILYSYYRYTISTVGSTTVLAGNRQSLRGEKGDQGNPGPAGQDGTPGQDGADGSHWYQGTVLSGITGDLTGVAGIIDDQYLNIATGNVYTCVITGTSTTAIWHYSGNIKGADGADATITSDTPPQNPTEDMLWLDTTTNVLKKYTLVADQGGTITGVWNVVNDYTTAIDNVQSSIDLEAGVLQNAIDNVNSTLGSRVEAVENKYTQMEETQEGFEFRVGTIETFKTNAETVVNEVATNFTFGNTGLELGKSDSDYKLQLTNESINIKYKNNITSFWDPHNFNSDSINTNQFGIGPFKWALRSNGSLSFRKEG